jgi:histidinol-phosphate/aromatic aminotransferase/cobyric acid decarboxylase-like protein
MEAWMALPEGIVVLRSMTKDHALAGVRVGFALAPTGLAARMEASRPPGSVKAMAQTAAIFATTPVAQRFVEESRARLLADAEALAKDLSAVGLAVHPSDTVYALAFLGAERSATHVRQRLLERHRVLVRDATSFGLPHHLRVAARPRTARERLVAALRLELSP